MPKGNCKIAQSLCEKENFNPLSPSFTSSLISATGASRFPVEGLSIPSNSLVKQQRLYQ